MLEFSARAPGSPDGLFLERLETFMDKCLADIKAFSERENRPFAEVYRICVVTQSAIDPVLHNRLDSTSRNGIQGISSILL